MSPREIIDLRLYNQSISENLFSKPEQLLSYMAGIQAQDYFGAKWSLGLRLKGYDDETIEAAINKRRIIRTWPMRGTLHFVAAKDIRWMLDLLAPHVLKQAGPRLRELGLTGPVLLKAHKILAKILIGQSLTRDEISEALEKGGIRIKDQRLSHILQHAAASQLICFGSRRGNQFTFTLLDEVVGPQKSLTTEKALAQLTYRYFQSRGPATIDDFIWWSGLPVKMAREGLEIVSRKLDKSTIGSDTFYFVPTETASPKAKGIYLLPGFDEYLIAYKDRSVALRSIKHASLAHRNGMFHPTIVIDGIVRGTWNRKIINDEVQIVTSPFSKFTPSERKVISRRAKEYADYLQLGLKN